MTQTVRTLIFMGAAVVCVAIAAGTHFANKPAEIAAFSDVGSEFYQSFKDPNEATALQVAAYNPATGKTDAFKVEFKDGLWRIPSHHDYPADAKDRLSKTAASMVGVTRQALEERSAASHRRFNLLDPLDRDVAGTEGRGARITLYKGDQTLVDFIVGKKVANTGNRYYVRRADEDRVYTADLGKLDVSTKFSDWIEQDVLDVEKNDVRELIINRYVVDEAQGKVVSEGQLRLTRDSSTAPWTLKGLDPETEQLKATEINSMLAALDDLKIVGVRPKPEGLSAGLKSSDGSIAIDPLIQLDLEQKGFFISRAGFVSKKGEVNVGTNQGVFYVLGFGEEFSGTDVEIEVGKHSPAVADDSSKHSTDGEDQAKSAEEQSSTAEHGKKSRYLFVTVHFDKSLLGEPPAPPTKPEPPAETQASTTPAESPAADPAAPPADPNSTTSARESDAGPATAEPDAQQKYQDALKRFDEDQRAYEFKKKEYDKKLEDGQKRVDELSRRFADWYYVISEDSFERLKLTRDALVEKKKPVAETPEQKSVGDADAIEDETPDRDPSTDQPSGDERSADGPAGPVEVPSPERSGE